MDEARDRGDGIAWRQAVMSGDTVAENLRAGMLQALGDVLVHHGQDHDTVAAWIDEAKGSTDD